MVDTPHATYYSTPLLSQTRPDPSSSISDIGELAKETTIRRLVHVRDPTEQTSKGEPRANRQHKSHKARLRHIPILSTNTPTPRGPATYSQHLTPTPSLLHPHCLARDQLQRWTLAPPTPNPLNGPALTQTECDRVMDIMVHAWEEGTCVLYGTGLLMWHCFCNERGVPKEGRAPATQALVSSFMVHLAAAYSGRTIARYINGVRA